LNSSASANTGGTSLVDGPGPMSTRAVSVTLSVSVAVPIEDGAERK
jgi:hypothetical protein